MTALEMNAAHAKKMNGGTRVLALAALGLAGVGAGAVAGCAAAPRPPVEGLPPVTPQAQALVEANRRYPRWADFPAVAVDLPTPAEISGRVGALGTAADSLAADTRQIVWTLEDPAGFAASLRSRLDAADLAPLTAATQAEVEVFAESLRRRGAAPPPIDRRR